MKGFTLIELIVVIVILGLMALVAFPAVSTVINESRISSYCSQVKIIEKAAKAWGVEHSSSLPINSTPTTVTIATLVSGGYVSSGTPKDDAIENNTLKDPRGGNMSGYVQITLSGNKYNYVYVSNTSSDNTLCK